MAPKKTTTGPYDPNYEEQLNKQNIWFIKRPKDHELPQNYHEIISRLCAERPDDPRGPVVTTHDAFLERNENASTSQEALFQQVMPIIWGTFDLEVPCAYNRPFTRMRFAEKHLKDAKPDYFEGIKPTHIEAEVKEDLSEMIIPNVVTALTGPAAPNFFLEVKTEGMRGSVVQLQSVMDGVLGARCMHSLQNYRMDMPLYDGNAYTFSVSYYRSELRFYAIQIKPPSMNSSKPRYEVLQLKWFPMEAKDKFLPAINAYRNIRDLAEEYRKKFVKDANYKVSNPTLGTLSASSSATDHPDSEGNAFHDDSAVPLRSAAKESQDVEEDNPDTGSQDDYPELSNTHCDQPRSDSQGAADSRSAQKEQGTGSQEDVQALLVTQPDAADDSAESEPDFGPPPNMSFQQQEAAESFMPQPRRSTRLRRRAREDTNSQSPPPRKRGRGGRQRLPTR